MIIFRNDEFGNSLFPPIPVWTLKQGKLKGEDTIILINGIGDEVKVDRNKVMENFYKDKYRIIENENKIAVIPACEVL